MADVKTIGVLTSGGDAPGMNAAVRAVVRAADNSGMRVYGIQRGYVGLIGDDMTELSLPDVCNVIDKGGTFIYTARCPEFREQAGILKGKENCIKRGIDGIVVVGGDGSFRGASDLSYAGIPCVGIPGTIDNDISSSDYTIGYDTALNTAREMIDKLRDTCESHYRCSVVEVMGRNCGDIALNVGIACGATAILVPEIGGYDIQRDVIDKILRAKAHGKKNFIIVVAEGIGGVRDMAKQIEEVTGIESRGTVLGHVQRGGSPTVRDRVVASEMGVHAVDLLAEGIGNRVVVMKDNKIIDLDIHEALQMKRKFDKNLYEMASRISI